MTNQTIASFHTAWHKLRNGNPSNTELDFLADQIANFCIDRIIEGGSQHFEGIQLLCEMACFYDQGAKNSIAAKKLFGTIIETLCDSFDNIALEIYNRIMTNIITSYVHKNQATLFAHNLDKFARYWGTDLELRISKLINEDKLLPNVNKVKNIFLLSRVTIGADIAISSVIIQRLLNFFKLDSIVIFGNSKIEQIFGNNPIIRFRNIAYPRRGGLQERLNVWNQLVEGMQKELHRCGEKTTIVIDMDSRLTQLGLLPVTDKTPYYLFPSRKYDDSNAAMTMVELANAWFDRISGTEDFSFPKIWLPDNLTIAAEFSRNAKIQGAKNIICVNLGFGGNPNKKLDEETEKRLILELLKTPNTVVVLDKGFGEMELRVADSIMSYVRENGFTVRKTDYITLGENGIGSGMVTIQCSIGELCSIIAACDQYIGYDSAGQHIAAATETPSITLFIGNGNMRFIRRWRAFGKKPSHVIYIPNGNTMPCDKDITVLIERVKNTQGMLPSA